MTSHDTTLVLFQWIIKQDDKNKYLITEDGSQSAETVHVQDDVNLHILCMLEDTFLLDAAYVVGTH